jgi:N-acylneuraminate cytidylyltransferase
MVSNIIAVIPARGGSKGIPKKNVKLLKGKPLIEYTINAINESRFLTNSYLSSENEEILTLAKEYNMKTIKRPVELALDTTPTVPVLQHAVNHLEPKIGKIDIIVLLQPTTPFKHGEDIDKAIKILQGTNADSVISLIKVSNGHPAWMYRLEEDRVISLWGDDYKYKRRQDLPPIYLRSGVIYAMKRHTVMEMNSLEGKDSRGLVLPVERSINIDTIIDFEFAEFMLERFNSQ